jgi:hypothetical protein
MKTSFLCKPALIAAALCLAPATLSANPRTTNSPARSTQAIIPTANLDATSLLQSLQSDAQRVKSESDNLHTLTNQPFLIDWRADGILLQHAQADVDAMDTALYRLRLNQPKYIAWQRTLISRIAPTVATLTDTTQAALASLSHNTGRIAFSDLHKLAGDMYSDAGQIDLTIAHFNKYEYARSEARELGRTLRLNAGS